MHIIHLISFCSYVKNCGCYGNQKNNSENGGISDNDGAGRGPYQGSTLTFFTARPSDQLLLKCTSPNLMSTRPQMIRHSK